jgi:hypothetical protein
VTAPSVAPRRCRNPNVSGGVDPIRREVNRNGIVIAHSAHLRRHRNKRFK